MIPTWCDYQEKNKISLIMSNLQAFQKLKKKQKGRHFKQSHSRTIVLLLASRNLNGPGLHFSWLITFHPTFIPLCQSIAFWHWKAIELSSKYYILHSEPKLIIPFGNCWRKTRLVDFKNSSLEKMKLKYYFIKIIDNISK